MTAGLLLPRDWDGGRLLRFLAGLAMLALAFAANAGLIATPAAPAPAAPRPSVATTVDVPAVDAPAAVVPAVEAPAPAGQPMITVELIEIGNPVIEPTRIAEPAGVVPGSHGSRAPPVV